MYSVYKHTSPSGKVYVGITKKVKPEYRWCHGRGYSRHQDLFWNAIVKYGWDNIKHDIIATGLTADEAKQMEISLIAYYKSIGMSYNITDGGDGGKGNKSHLGQKASEESRRKMSLARIGKKCPNRKPSAIEKRKYGKNNKNSKVVYQYTVSGEFIKQWDCLSDVQRELGIFTTNISAACRGKTFILHGYRWSYNYPYIFPEEEKYKREEKKKKLSEIAKLGYATGKRKPMCGKDNPMFGKRGELCCNYGLRGKLSPLKKTVYQYTKTGEFVKKWDCIVDIAEECGFERTSISANCVGKIRSAYGFVWSHLSPEEYVPDYTNRHLGAGKQRLVYQYDLKGNLLQEWKSTLEVEKVLGISNGQISKACRSGCKAHGYYWSYNLR